MQVGTTCPNPMSRLPQFARRGGALVLCGYRSVVVPRLVLLSTPWPPPPDWTTRTKGHLAMVSSDDCHRRNPIGPPRQTSPQTTFSPGAGVGLSSTLGGRIRRPLGLSYSPVPYSLARRSSSTSTGRPHSPSSPPRPPILPVGNVTAFLTTGGFSSRPPSVSWTWTRPHGLSGRGGTGGRARGRGTTASCPLTDAGRGSTTTGYARVVPDGRHRWSLTTTGHARVVPLDGRRRTSTTTGHARVVPLGGRRRASTTTGYARVVLIDGGQRATTTTGHARVVPLDGRQRASTTTGYARVAPLDGRQRAWTTTGYARVVLSDGRRQRRGTPASCPSTDANGRRQRRVTHVSCPSTDANGRRQRRGTPASCPSTDANGRRQRRGTHVSCSPTGVNNDGARPRRAH